MDGTENVKFSRNAYGSINPNASIGPSFYNQYTRQYDLLICDKPNEVKESSSRLGSGFNVPSGTTVKDTTTFLAGSNPFLVKELEVFALETFTV